MMICPPAGGGTTVWTGGAKKWGELGDITGTCGMTGGGTTAGDGNTATGDATFAFTGAFGITTTTAGGGNVTNPGTNGEKNTGATGGRMIVVARLGENG